LLLYWLAPSELSAQIVRLVGRPGPAGATGWRRPFDTAMGRFEKKSGSERLVGYAALKRFGTLEEIAELLAFCASSKPGCLTGVDILCDGGQS
jgi:NAD(P)-dependent dehydrogenase (short-subunit alcohol dehydrogenase family)